MKGVDVINARIDSIMDLSKFMITANLTILGINIALGRDISASGLWIVIPPILYLLIILIALIITIPKTKPIEEMDKNFFSSLILQRSRCYYILCKLFRFQIPCGHRQYRDLVCSSCE